MEGTASVSMLTCVRRFSVQSGLVQEYYGKSVADLGGQMGATTHPFTMKTQLWRPLFDKNSALILTQMHSFFRVSPLGVLWSTFRYTLEYHQENSEVQLEEL